MIWMLVIVFGSVTGVVGLLYGFRLGLMIGKEMAETAVIDQVNKDPFAPAYEVVDVLYPHRAELMIPVPEEKKKRDIGILSRNWGVVYVTMIVMLMGCEPQRTVTAHIGTVVDVCGDQVLVVFPVVSDKRKSMAANWFEIAGGHSYQVNDRYPDEKREKRDNER